MNRLTLSEMRNIVGGARVECIEDEELGCASCTFIDGNVEHDYWCCKFGDAGGTVCVRT